MGDDDDDEEDSDSCSGSVFSLRTAAGFFENGNKGDSGSTLRILVVVVVVAHGRAVVGDGCGLTEMAGADEMVDKGVALVF